MILTPVFANPESTPEPSLARRDVSSGDRLGDGHGLLLREDEVEEGPVLGSVLLFCVIVSGRRLPDGEN